jgi:hypothetical protein
LLPDESYYANQNRSDVLPLTEEVKKALQNAVTEARRDRKHSIGPEHILLGILIDPDDLVVQILNFYYVTPTQIKELVSQILRSGLDVALQPAMLEFVSFDGCLEILEKVEQGTITIGEAKDLLATLHITRLPIGYIDELSFQQEYIAIRALRLRVTNTNTGVQKLDIKLPMRKALSDLGWLSHRIKQRFIGKFSDWTVGDDFIELFIE